MCKNNAPSWQEELTEILEDEKLTGTVTLHIQTGKVKQFEVMKRYRSKAETDD